MRAIAEPAVLAHSMALATAELWLDLLSIPWLCSPAERLQTACPDRELAPFCVAAHATGRVEPAWGSLRQRSCGCSLPAQPSRVPRRGQRVLVFPLEAFGKPELARAGSQ